MSLKKKRRRDKKNLVKETKKLNKTECYLFLQYEYKYMPWYVYNCYRLYAHAGNSNVNYKPT